MPAAPLSCPYCNAFVASPAVLRAGQRVPCPRCGEAFAYLGPADAPSPDTFTATPPPARQNEFVTASIAPGRRPNWIVAAGVLGVMAVMGLVGLLFALQTEAVRRAHDLEPRKDRSLPLYLTVFLGVWLAGLAFVIVREIHARGRQAGESAHRRVSLRVVLAAIAVVAVAGVGVSVLAVQINRNRAGRTPQPDEPDPVVIVAPPDLAALGYLPNASNVVAAVHVAEALQEPAGKEFLTRFRFGDTGVGLNTVEQWAGLKPEEIDHVALGLKAEGLLVPGWVVVVVRTRRPYDSEKLLS